jgi:hypothetical protein
LNLCLLGILACSNELPSHCVVWYLSDTGFIEGVCSGILFMDFGNLKCIAPGSSCFQKFFEKPVVILMGFPLSVIYSFFLASFNILYLVCILSVLTTISYSELFFFFNGPVYLVFSVLLMFIWVYVYLVWIIFLASC